MALFIFDYYESKWAFIFFFVGDRIEQVYNEASSTSSQETKPDQDIDTNIQGNLVYLFR